MKLGIIGMGVVGSANSAGFTLLQHQVITHDIKFDTEIKDVLDTEIVFVCVPTPNLEDDCDTEIVEEVIDDLNALDYKGIVCIRSTVSVGFTEAMIATYPHMRICFAPEFLRERCAADDFINNHELLAVGTNDPYVYKKIVEAHGHLPKNTKQLSPTEAEILKYYNNTYAALRIVFANIFYEVAEEFDCDYSKIKDAYVATGKTNDLYLDVNAQLRGYSGMCLPKDVKAFNTLLRNLDLNYGLIHYIDADNKQFNKTVFSGMRNA